MRKLAATCIFVLICAVGFAQMQAGTIGPRPVPVNQGGTGDDDAAGARTNLDVYSTTETGATAAAAVSTHNALSAAHNATALASEAKVASDISDHNALNAAHGCTNVASEAALTAHTSAVAAHGCTNVASAAAVALKADLAGSSGQSFAADEIQADTLRSASGASTAISLSNAGVVSMERQPFVEATCGNDVATLTSAVGKIASFPTVVTDTHGNWDTTAGNNHHFDCTVSGRYLFELYLVIEAQAVTAGEYLTGQILVDGAGASLQLGTHEFQVSRTLTTGYAYKSSIVVNCVAGKAYSIYMLNATAQHANVSGARLTISKIQ